MYDDTTHEPVRAGAPPPAPVGAMPMLSVLLLLLAFFIMLVSMVEFDERRTQAALGSLSATFNVRSAESPEQGSGAGAGASGVMHNVSIEVGAVLKTLLRDGSFAVEVDGAVAAIRIDNDQLFARGLAPAPALDAFAARLAAILAAAPDHFRYDIQIVEPLGEAGATRRAGGAARAFAAAGIAPARLTASLATGVAGQTRIEIYTLTPAEDAGRWRRQPRTPVR